MNGAGDAKYDAKHIESLLVRHPGVRRAVVVKREHEPLRNRLVAYVVPDHLSVEEGVETEGEDLARLEEWRKVYDWFERGREEHSALAGLNTRIWNSSYTRAAIPEDQMREWCDMTVERILEARPSGVLDIGCGTGALLLRIAPHCERYVGVDFSGASLRTLAREMQQLGGTWRGVSLLERPADRLEQIDGAPFDVVVLNSVVQCFPSTDYLNRVLERAIELAAPHGVVLVGDVRSLPLLEAFAVSVELYRAPEDLSLADLRQRVRKRLQQERELVLSPAFFLDLQRRIPGVAHVEIAPKLTSADNEMTRFRYDVTIHLGDRGQRPLLTPRWMDWDADGMGPDTVDRLLQCRDAESVGVRGVHNPRVVADVRAVRLLETLPASSTVEELRLEAGSSQPGGMTPDHARSLAHAAGYGVELSWAACRGDGSYDVIFRSADRRAPLGQRVNWPQASDSDARGPLVSDPSRIARRRRFLQGLTAYLREQLQGSEGPAEVVLLSSLPGGGADELDPEALPPPPLAFHG